MALGEDLSAYLSGPLFSGLRLGACNLLFRGGLNLFRSPLACFIK